MHKPVQKYSDGGGGRERNLYEVCRTHKNHPSMTWCKINESVSQYITNRFCLQFSSSFCLIYWSKAPEHVTFPQCFSSVSVYQLTSTLKNPKTAPITITFVSFKQTQVVWFVAHLQATQVELCNSVPVRAGLISRPEQSNYPFIKGIVSDVGERKHQLAPHYSVLLQATPTKHPQMTGILCKRWSFLN